MKFHHIGIACSNIEQEIINIKNIQMQLQQAQKKQALLLNLQENLSFPKKRTSNGTRTCY